MPSFEVSTRTKAAMSFGSVNKNKYGSTRARPVSINAPALSNPSATKRARLNESKSSSSSSSTSTLSRFNEEMVRLNEGQTKAVNASTDEHLAIFAAAGSGKTTTMTSRIARLLRQGVKPSEVLPITFSRKAAQQLEEKIWKLIPRDDNHGLEVKTFHAFCLGWLQEHHRQLGFNRRFEVVSNEKIVELLGKLLDNRLKEEAENVAVPAQVMQPDAAEMNAFQPADAKLVNEVPVGKNQRTKKERDNLVYRFKRGIMKCKQDNTPPNMAPDASLFDKVYADYQQALSNMQGMDYQDFVPQCLQMLSLPAIRNKLQKKYRYIFVDEFQDVSADQLNLVLTLAGKTGKVTVCGDDDQSIYGFRNAMPHAFAAFEAKAKASLPVQTCILDQSYRSTQLITKACQKMIANNEIRTKKNLWTLNVPGEKLRVFAATNSKTEADLVLQHIQAEQKRLNLNYGDFAILGRTSAVVRGFHNAVKNHPLGMVFSYKATAMDDVPDEDYGAEKTSYDITDSHCWKDLCAHLFVMAFSRSKDRRIRECLNRVRDIPTVGLSRWWPQIETLAAKDKIGLYCAVQLFARDKDDEHKVRQFTDRITKLQLACKQASVVDTIETIMNATYHAHIAKVTKNKPEDLVKKQKQIATIMDMARKFDMYWNSEREAPGQKDFARVKSFLGHYKKRPAYHQNQHRVFLNTIHQAKGLEWKVVFVIGANDGVIPLPNRAETEDAVRAHLEEERRIFYVAMSRAKDLLYVSTTQTGIDGQPLVPSRFLSDIPQECILDTKDPSIKTDN